MMIFVIVRNSNMGLFSLVILNTKMSMATALLMMVIEWLSVLLLIRILLMVSVLLFRGKDLILISTSREPANVLSRFTVNVFSHSARMIGETLSKEWLMIAGFLLIFQERQLLKTRMPLIL